MSKQKTHDSDTENVVTENLNEQTELEGLSTATEEPVKTESTPVVETVVDAAPKSSGSKLKINKVATAKVAANKKMGVYKFLSLYPQDIYISTLLKFYYPKSFFTVEQWFQRIEEILNTPINN